MEIGLTILWTTLLDYERVLIVELSELYKAEARELASPDLGPTLGAALVRGAVVVIATGDKQASLALSLGADEVIRSGELTGRVLDETIQRALTRAEARRDRELRRSVTQVNEHMGFALLAAAIGYELTAPVQLSGISGPSAECARRVLDVAQQLATRGPLWTDALAPDCNVSQPSPKKLESRAQELLESLERLGFAASHGEPLLVAPLLRDFTGLMARYVRSWAELEFRGEGDCAAVVPRALLTCSLAAVLADAVERIRASKKADGRIQFRCREREDCVLVEVEHNGATTASDLGPGILDGYFGKLATVPLLSCDVAGIREHLRQVGGELLADSSEERTLVRIFLPTSKLAALPFGQRCGSRKSEVRE